MITTTFTRDFTKHGMTITTDADTGKFELKVYVFKSPTQHTIVFDTLFDTYEQAVEKFKHIFRWNSGYHIDLPLEYNYSSSMTITRRSATL